MQEAVVPRILIADDSRAVREKLTDLLAAVPGVAIVGVASDVPSAELTIARTRPDLAILDLQMPGGAVLDLIARLKQERPTLRIAVMSTHATDYRELIVAAGADFVLHKARDIHQIEEIARIVLNERRAYAEAGDDEVMHPDAASANAAQGMGRVVLNVDDYKPSLYARTRVLRRAGFEVLEAVTGRDAIRMVEERMPDLVLLDVHLPDMSGLDVCRQIKSVPTTAAVAVVHISATFRSERDRADGLRLSGADAYLTEPVEPTDLVGIIERLLQRSTAERAKHSDRPTEE